MESEIRSYGPGKFDTVMDQYVYQVSLDGGCDDEISSLAWGDNWYGMMRNGSTIFRDHDPFLDRLNEPEQEKLTSAAGVILCETSDGFITVDYFATDAELDTAWEGIEQLYETDDADQ